MFVCGKCNQYWKGTVLDNNFIKETFFIYNLKYLRMQFFFLKCIIKICNPWTNVKSIYICILLWFLIIFNAFDCISVQIVAFSKMKILLNTQTNNVMFIHTYTQTHSHNARWEKEELHWYWNDTVLYCLFFYQTHLNLNYNDYSPKLYCLLFFIVLFVFFLQKNNLFVINVDFV